MVIGAIINSGAGQINALRNVTLAGHTTFGGDVAGTSGSGAVSAS
jgi:hypothetical protein